MPAIAKVTKDEIIDAAFEIARTEGAEHINARIVSAKLGCSTQPVMYHFKTIEKLRKAAYQKADAYHSAYISDIRSDDPMKDIGLNYIRFAVEEKSLFRFLFQSDSFSGRSILDLINAEETQPMVGILSREAGIVIEQAQTVFRTVFLCVHGYASMLANNDMTYDEKSIAADLDLVLYGTIGAIKGDMNEYERTI